MSKIEYPDWFEQMWSIYPKRAGGNPKRKAFKAINARLKQGYESTEIRQGLEAYVTFCEKTARIGSEFVMQAATFFGPDERWSDDWTPPKNTGQKPDWAKLPFDDNQLQAFAAKHGLPKPKSGEYYPQYRQRLRIAIEAQLTQRQE